MNNSPEKLNRSIRWILTFFIAGLVLSGLTALPIEWQLQLAHEQIKDWDGDVWLVQWLEFVYQGVKETNSKYPFISYGTDWLAFAHFIMALVFIGPWRDPIKNIWVIEFGILACVLIFPFSLIAGAVRGIPLYWRMIDCSFGIFGGLLLLICYYKVKKLQNTFEIVR
ncbi:MAG TPA: hypothetical protein PLJ60_21055 [Chryseolinea sp.]|nr:hypothetical protein [Chryseolinea sp.]HPM32835.1 hypothetical protein [Chryseolinea sp.]